VRGDCLAFAGVRRNADVPWDAFDVERYVADNYAALHDADREIIRRMSAYYRRMTPGSAGRTLELGAGPNLYPLMLAGGVSRAIDVVEPSAANVAHLRRVLSRAPDAHWTPFWETCRAANPDLPGSLSRVLGKVRVLHAGADDLPVGRYGGASMFFVAESVTGDPQEFRAICARLACAVRPGGYVVAAFMAGMPSYELAGELLPSCPVDAWTVREALAPYLRELRLTHIPPDPSLPYDCDGMLLATGRRPDRPAPSVVHLVDARLL
jgi:hypothetical protein